MGGEKSTILSPTAQENEEQHNTNVHKYYSTVQRRSRRHGNLLLNTNLKKLYTLFERKISRPESADAKKIHDI